MNTNLFNAPMHKLEDRKAILARVHDALLNDPDAQFNFKGEWRQPTHEQIGNWESRQAISKLSMSFPDSKPPVESQGDEGNTHSDPAQNCN